jgi:hypothetical protein
MIGLHVDNTDPVITNRPRCVDGTVQDLEKRLPLYETTTTQEMCTLPKKNPSGVRGYVIAAREAVCSNVRVENEGNMDQYCRVSWRDCDTVHIVPVSSSSSPEGVDKNTSDTQTETGVHGDPSGTVCSNVRVATPGTSQNCRVSWRDCSTVRLVPVSSSSSPEGVDKKTSDTHTETGIHADPSGTVCSNVRVENAGTSQNCRVSWRDCSTVRLVPVSSSSSGTSTLVSSPADEGGIQDDVPNDFKTILRSDIDAALPLRLECEKRPYNFVRRNKRVKAVEHVVHKKMSLKEILKVRGMWCCRAKMCCSKIDISAIRDIRLEFYQLRYEERQKWWMDSLKRFTILVNGREMVRPVVGKTNICCAAWCNIVGVHRKTISRKIKEARSGGVRPEHGLRGSMRFSDDYVTIATLTKTFIDNHADQMPDENVTNSVGEVRVKLKLPASYNKK